MTLRHTTKSKGISRKNIFLMFILLLTFSFLMVKTVFSPDSKIVLKAKEIEEYYVPVTNYWSEIENINSKELSSKISIIEKEEKENLSGLVSQNVSVKEISEIQNGLKENEIALVKWSSVVPSLKTLPVDNKYIWEDLDYPIKVKVKTDSEIFDFSKVIKINAAGDVMLSRNVGVKINKYGVFNPWKKTTDIGRADITFLNLEVPISDLFPAPTTGMSFIAPLKNIEALVKSGTDIVSVANNHTANFGYKVFEDSLNNLRNGGISTCGGGKSEEEARKPKIIEKKGQKFAFLCYSSITGTLFSKGEKSGAAGFRIEPWFRDEDSDIKAIQKDIAEAKKLADVVIVSPHWGVEYKVDPNESQKKVAKAMVNAGADLILGTHPHVVQASEFIEGKFVTYSLGNFIFDQEWSQETKEGLVLENYFYGKKQVAAVMRPVLIEDYHQPKFLEGTLKKAVINRIKDASLKLIGN